MKVRYIDALAVYGVTLSEWTCTFSTSWIFLVASLLCFVLLKPVHLNTINENYSSRQVYYVAQSNTVSAT